MKINYDHPLQFLEPRLGPQKGPPLTDEDLNRYLIAFSLHGTMTKACREAGIPVWKIRAYRKHHPEFEELVDQAKEVYRERIREHFNERVMSQIDKGVYYKGEEIAREAIVSDRLMELAMKASFPEEFNDRVRVDAKVSGGVLVAPAIAGSTEEWLKAAESYVEVQGQKQEALPAPANAKDDE